MRHSNEVRDRSYSDSEIGSSGNLKPRRVMLSWNPRQRNRQDRRLIRNHRIERDGGPNHNYRRAWSRNLRKFIRLAVFLAASHALHSAALYVHCRTASSTHMRIRASSRAGEHRHRARQQEDQEDEDGEMAHRY